MTKDLFAVLSEAPGRAVFWAFCFGLLWGIGGLTFGLTMRYLGMSLGMAVVLGLCAAFGTLMPPIFAGHSSHKCRHAVRTGHRDRNCGVFGGIAVAGLAGLAKERTVSLSNNVSRSRNLA